MEDECKCIYELTYVLVYYIIYYLIHIKIQNNVATSLLIPFQRSENTNIVIPAINEW